MRDYDPTTGRYMQADPLGLVDGVSVYGYVRQNPGRYVDPTGAVGIPGALAGAIAGGFAGYISSGCLQGAFYGAIIGAGVGFTGGTYGLTAAGAGAVGFGAAGLGQIAANYLAACDCGDEPEPLLDLLSSPQFWGTNFGAAIGGGLSSGFASNFATSITARLFGKAPYFGSRANQASAVNVFVAEGVGGIGAGAGELVGSQVGSQW